MRSIPYKFGVGVTEEIGDDVTSLGVKRVLVITDLGVAATGLPNRVLNILQDKTSRPSEPVTRKAVEQIFE